MIDKCANPECNERLVYLRSGVLYAVNILSASNPQRATHFFWLCEPCSIQFTLHFDGQSEPRIVPGRTRNSLPESSDSEHGRVRRIFVNQKKSPAKNENDCVGNEHEKVAGRITPAKSKMLELTKTHLLLDVKCRDCA